MIQYKGDIQLVYVATHPQNYVINQNVVDFKFNNTTIFFYFLDEEEMNDYIDDGSQYDWDLIDYKYITDKLSMEFEWFSKN